MPKRIYRDPNKPYIFRKIDDLTDEQSKSDSTLGSTRARARAIIMEEDGLHRLVNEVRIIIGPKFDMLIKLNPDKDELIFDEELVDHESKKSIEASENMMCISLPIQAKDRRFILDSGSGHDLISARKAERMNLKKRNCEPILFHTANGSTATHTEVEIDLGTFDDTSHAYVLDDTPSVMSLGKRCMEEGYSFVWPSGKMPFLITKDGERIDLTIHDNIPHVDLGTYECTPYECQQITKIHELLENFRENLWDFDNIEDTGRPTRRVCLDGESGLETDCNDQQEQGSPGPVRVGCACSGRVRAVPGSGPGSVGSHGNQYKTSLSDLATAPTSKELLQKLVVGAVDEIQKAANEYKTCLSDPTIAPKSTQLPHELVLGAVDGIPQAANDRSYHSPEKHTIAPKARFRSCGRNSTSSQ